LSYFDRRTLFGNAFVLSWATAFCAFRETLDLFDLAFVTFDIINNFGAFDSHFLFVTTFTGSFAVGRTALVFFLNGLNVFSFTRDWFFWTAFLDVN